MEYSIPKTPAVALLRHAFEALMARAARRQLRPDTIDTYRTYWHRVARDLNGDRPLRSFRGRELQAWLDALRAQFSVATTRAYRRFVAMLFNAAAQAELFKGSNPIGRTEPIRRGLPVPRRRLNGEEALALFVVLRADSSRLGRLWATVFGIMLVTGLRVRETVLLRWEDFMWDRGLVKPSHQKRSNGDDILLISPELERIVAIWGHGESRAGLLFAEPTYTKIRHFCGQALRVLRCTAKVAGISDPRTLTTHSLRRTFIGHAADAARGDHLALMQVARHRDLNVTKLYMPSVTKAVREVSLAAANAAGVAMGLTSKEDVAGETKDSLRKRVLAVLADILPPGVES